MWESLTPRPHLDTSVTTDVRTASGSKLMITGTCTIAIEIASRVVKVPVLVSENIQFDLILGNKFLERK